MDIIARAPRHAPASRLLLAGLLALPLLACGNKGPLILAPRPAAEPVPAPAPGQDVPPPDVERADAPPVPAPPKQGTPRPDAPR